MTSKPLIGIEGTVIKAFAISRNYSQIQNSCIIQEFQKMLV
ncbi:hypothetical protein HMPREF6123_1071 [Oribacterium sinus F0268]|uniref:Uncharacterized protein n=1 Tax=Oribacterium sinus F0268 TaxID=585501 RepID=C2KX52_9FIRM|nr:hypothetical protein HMPREF6123_1071 [Oribacterium sinus F0268]